MVEVWTAPFVATTGEIIASSDANAGYRGNLLYLRQFLSANPAGAGLALISTGVNGAGFSYAPVNKVGDTMSGALQVNSTIGATGNITSSAGGGIFAGGVIAASGGGTFSGVVQGSQLKSTVAIGTAPLDVTSTTVVPNLNASQLAGVAGSGYALVAHKVPLGAVVWFETAAELTAAGAAWARYTAADGRLLVGAGASASSQVFTEATNYGANWTPATAVSVSDTIGVSNGTLAATVGSLVGLAAASPTTTVVAGGAGFTVSLGSHTHGVTISGDPGLSGSVAKSGGAAIAGTSTVWVPYMRAGVWGRHI